MMRWTAWAVLALAAVGLVMFLATEFAPMLGAAVSLGIAGVVLLGFDRALNLLSEIRDSLAAARVPAAASDGAEEPSQLAYRDAAALGDAIDRKKSAQG